MEYSRSSLVQFEQVYDPIKVRCSLKFPYEKLTFILDKL